MLNHDPHVYFVDNSLHQAVLERGVTSLFASRLDVPKVGQTDTVTLMHNGHAIEMVKRDGAWSFTGENAGRADQEKVDQLLGAVRAIWISKFDLLDHGKEALSLYGLNHPRTVLTIHLPGISNEPSGDQKKKKDESKPGASTQPADHTPPAGKPRVMRLRIGAPVDAKEDSFFANWSEGDRISGVLFRINESDLKKLDKTVNDLRDARMTPIPEADIKQVRIERQGHEPIVIERTAEGFAFGKPAPQYSLDQEQAKSLIKRLAEAKAEGYVTGASPRGDALTTIKLTAVGRPEPDQLRIYPAPAGQASGATQPAPKRMVLRNNETTGYLIKTADLSGVFEPILSLRDRTILKLDADALKTIHIQQSMGESFTFQRKMKTGGDGKDTQSKPGPWELAGYDRYETDALDALIEVFTPLRAEAWIADASTPGATPLEVTIETFAGDHHTLRIDPTNRHAALDDLGAVFQVGEPVLTALEAEFRYRTLVSTVATNIDQITITRDGRSMTITKNDDGDYVDGQGMMLNQEAAVGLWMRWRVCGWNGSSLRIPRRRRTARSRSS